HPAVVEVLTDFIHFHPLWCSAGLALHEWLTGDDSSIKQQKDPSRRILLHLHKIGDYVQMSLSTSSVIH
ncbi:hypothetical protein, partial [Paenibacillus baekrokdamisoli]|uniref:hypothetical protein n=1 Tax=Paenibacillus baekrokdamisoli TaxID=1712516 RepID=UPI001C8442BB